jgi:competence protein ComEA
MRQVVYILVGVLIGSILVGALFFLTRLPDGNPVTLEPAPTAAPITVQVIGAVVRPGVYSFAGGGRVADAVTAAGGLLSTANPDAINLAAKLEDGQQLNIPYQSGSVPGPGSPSIGPFTVVITPTPQQSSANLININTASLAELETLPGIGSTVAQKIIDYRQLHGSFLKIEDLMNIPGIGLNTFDNIKFLISVN